MFGQNFILLHTGNCDLEEVSECIAGLPIVLKSCDEPAVSEVYHNIFTLIRPDGYIVWQGNEIDKKMRDEFKVFCGQHILKVTTIQKDLHEAVV